MKRKSRSLFILTFASLTLLAAAASGQHRDWRRRSSPSPPPAAPTPPVASNREVTNVTSAATPTEAVTGFDGGSNGFAEEFCANQRDLVSSPNSPKVPADECSLDAAEAEFRGPETVADGLGPIF